MIFLLDHCANCCPNVKEIEWYEAIMAVLATAFAIAVLGYIIGAFLYWKYK